MDSDDPVSEWIISGCSSATASDAEGEEQLLLSARRVWPYVRAHASRELGWRRDDPENATLAAEVWEGVLRSIVCSLRRLRISSPKIANMDSYLMGAFRHRFSRIRIRQKRREQTIQLVATTTELDALAAKRGWHSVINFEQRIFAKQIFGFMDQWMRRVWTARQYGYSWKEIGLCLNKGEDSVKMKFKYRLSKLRSRLTT